MTFSIVARDSKTGNTAVCGGSHWFAYATLVPYIKAGIGAVATQAECNLSYGPEGLALLEQGKSSDEVVRTLIGSDRDNAIRQLLVIDKNGNTAAYTGEKCVKFAFHHTEPNLAIAGNMLKNDKGIPIMVEAFHSSPLPFAQKLIYMMQIGQETGGDMRGKRSAGLLITKPHEGERPLYDLRIDDHQEPFIEIDRLYQIARTYRLMAKGDQYQFEKKDDEKAVKYYEKAYHGSPDNEEVLFWYAKLLVDVGREKEGLELKTKLTAKNSMWVKYWDRVAASEQD